MNREYVSEFTAFMNRYLKEHPEAVKEQRRGWRIYWDHKIDEADLERAAKDSVPDDGYGFHWPAWRGQPSPEKDGKAR